MATTLLKEWYRPSLMILTASAPTASVASVGSWTIGSTAGTDYLFLTDDNRSSLQVGFERIESRKRMINGRMRSYHVVDKKSFSVSWTDLPSSASYLSENRTGLTSGWGAGKDMLTWYQNNPDSFYLMLVYDTPDFEGTGSVPLKYKIETYNVFFDSFDYTVTKRGLTHDLWDVSMSLVEV